MKILGIETSCDETAASVVEDGKKILSNVVVSQVDIFAAYGGVIPEVAARSHLEAILPVIDKALKDAKTDWSDIDAIAVTHTPGLLGSLLIGTLTARTLAILHKKPLYPVHHLKSHIYANWLEKCQDNVQEISKPSFEATKENSQIFRGDREGAQSMAGVTRSALRSARPVDEKNMTEFSPAKKNGLDIPPRYPSFPLLSLIISGGHTQILYMKKHNDFEIIGTTLDDAVGECFDKVAKILGLPYPGGPSIAKAAKTGNKNKYHLPHPKTENPLDFSFSGLKTAVLRAVQKELNLPISHPSHDLKNHLTDQQVADFAASFEQTAVNILLEKLTLALNTHSEVKSIVFAGGVSANERLRLAGLSPEASFSEHVSSPLIRQHFPHPSKNVAGASRTAFARIERTMLWNLQGAQKLAKKKMVSGEKQNTISIFFPEKSLSGDNGAMVASAAYFEIKSGVLPSDPYKIDILPRSKINEQ